MAIAQETRICPTCRAETKIGSRFCHVCGTDMELIAGPPGYDGAPVPVTPLPGAQPPDAAGSSPGKLPSPVYPPAQAVWSGQPPALQLPEIVVPSGYVARKLQPGERVYYHVRASNMRIFDIVMVVIFGPVVLLIISWMLSFFPIPYIMLLVPFLAIALLLNIIGSIISLASSELALTDRRIVGRWGRLIQREIDIPLDWLTDVFGKPSLLSEGYGLLYLATVRKSGYQMLDSVRNPAVFASLASQLMGPNKRETIKKALSRQRIVLVVLGVFLLILGAAAVYLWIYVE
jgi:hypothetical protein